MDRQNLTLLTDLYELTMMQGYFKNKDQNETVIFDAFYRNNPCDGGFAIAAGLDQLIQYIKELHFEKEDIDYLAGLGIFEPDFLPGCYVKIGTGVGHPIHHPAFRVETSVVCRTAEYLSELLLADLNR